MSAAPKFNARVGRDTPDGNMNLSNRGTSADVVKISSSCAIARGEVDDIDHLGSRRVHCVGELAENQYRGLRPHRRPSRGRLGQAGEALMPHDLDQLEADLCG